MISDLEQAVKQLVQSDENMKNPKITLRLRGEDWRSSTVKVATARTKLMEHRSVCTVCKEEL